MIIEYPPQTSLSLIAGQELIKSSLRNKHKMTCISFSNNVVGQTSEKLCEHDSFMQVNLCLIRKQE